MGVEVVGFEMINGPADSVPAAAEVSVLNSKVNGNVDQFSGHNEPIKFGSHEEEPIKEEGNVSSATNTPKDAADEWPAPRQIHSFYFIKHRSYDDPNIKAKIDLADKEIQKRSQARFQITEALKAKRSDRAQLITQMKSSRDDNRQFKSIVDEKIKEIEPLNQALGKLRNANNAGRNGGLCSSEEELNSIIHSLQYRIQHESIPLSEEKQILRDIKQLEGTREKVIANAAVRAKLQDSFVQKEALQDQVKIIGGDLDGVRKEQQVVRAKIKHLDDALKAIDNDIKTLQDDLAAVTEKRGRAHESIQQLRKNRDEGNAYFYQSRAILNKARDFAAKKDIKALEDLSFTEVEKFMSLWNSDKAFRDDYEKRILPSLDFRQLSRDGRIRNPDEKPLVSVAEPAPPQTETMPKPNIKRTKEESKPIPSDTLSAQKVDKEVKQKVDKEVKQKVENKTAKSLTPLEHVDEADEEIPGLEKLSKDTSKEVDPVKLKEMKREEEIAKAKQAMERKKKQQEKAAAKANLRAQKEAEKKMKDREKKAKKKAAASTSAVVPEEEPTESVEEISTELENVNEEDETPVPAKQVKKEISVRSRGRQRGADSVAKIIRKRKKSTNYWDWAAPAAAAALLLVILAVLGYYYLL